MLGAESSDPWLKAATFVWKANSFEELAELMGVDSEALAATMEDYNNRAKGDGSHDPLGADPALMTPLEKKPFYAVQVEACAIAPVAACEEIMRRGRSDTTISPSRACLCAASITVPCSLTTIPMGCMEDRGRVLLARRDMLLRTQLARIWVLPSDHLTDDPRSLLQQQGDWGSS